MLVKQGLVLLVAATEVLQELVGQAHQLVHAHVFLAIVRDLKQIENDSVHAHVSQEALLVFARPHARVGRRSAGRGGSDWNRLYAKPVHSRQNLLDLLVVDRLRLVQRRADVQIDS